MAGRGDGDDIFGRLFGGFMDSNIDEHFREMTRQMDEMFKNFGFGDIRFQGELPAPPVQSGSGKPPFMENPREQMLKNASSSSVSTAPSNTDRQTPTDLPRQPFSPNRFSPFRRPDGNLPVQNIGPGAPDQLSGQTTQPGNFVSSWTSSSWNSSSSNDGKGWKQSVVQTVRHPDGTVERIEKTTQNGRTCTTTTTTDPHGITSTQTTCDKPAIDGPLMKDGPDSSKPSSEPKFPQPNNTGYSKEDIGFFKKMFGFDIFKPKD